MGSASKKKSRNSSLASLWGKNRSFQSAPMRFQVFFGLLFFVLSLSSCGGSGGSGSNGPMNQTPNPEPQNLSPTVEILGDALIVLPFGSTYSEPGAVASDPEDGDLTSQIQISGDSVDPFTSADYVISYEVTDSGNLSASVERTVTVLENEPPSMSLLGDEIITLAWGESYSESGVSATDPEDGDLTSQVQISGSTVDPFVAGTYLISYEVIDSGGLSASMERSVIVLENEPPSIFLLGDELVTLAYAEAFTDPGATALDPEDGNLNSQVQIAGDTVNSLVSGSYVISYSVTDAGGLTTSIERTVTILPNQPPVVTLVGQTTIYIEQGGTFTDPGATATDPEQGDISDSIIVDSNVDTNTPGNYIVTYAVSDIAGASDQAERTVVVTAPEPDYCEDVDLNAQGIFDDIIQRWVDQDNATPRRTGSVVFAGSSSIRYWEALYQNYSSLDPIQRGFGASRIWDVAQNSDDLIARHAPSAVVIFASNSIPQGLTVEQTVEGYQCLVQRLEDTLNEVPIIYIGMTPTPARWDIWPEFNDANQQIQALTEGQTNLFYVDAPTEFLRTGSPPSLSLFQDDQIHLTESGYQIWLDLLTPLLDSILPNPPLPPTSTLGSGRSILVDLGPSNAEDGTLTSSPDGFGQVWNNWADAEGQEVLYAGESLGDLVDTLGNQTNVRLILTGEMSSNGLLNGGLQNPNSMLLGSFAIDSATQDYFFALEDSLGAGSLSFVGLNEDDTYRVRLFSSRSAPDTRITRYVVTGGGSPVQVDLQVSGSGIGETTDGNDRDIADFTGILPDEAGAIHIDFTAEAGDFSYLSIIELTAE